MKTKTAFRVENNIIHLPVRNTCFDRGIRTGRELFQMGVSKTIAYGEAAIHSINLKEPDAFLRGFQQGYCTEEEKRRLA